MNNSSTPGLFTSANSSTSTLRPRNTRLISYSDEDNASTPESSDTLVVTNSSTSSRNTSAISSRVGTPSPGPTGAGKTHRSADSTLKNNDKAQLAMAQRGAVNGLWDSWSSLQSVASTLLGSDTSGGRVVKTGKATTAFKAPAWMRQERSHNIQPSTKWGPNVNHTASEALPGSIEERQAFVQAKRREALLTVDPKENRDTAGRFKRRDSDSNIPTINDTDPDGEALVYLHQVTPQDTLAGVMIKYGCQPEVFRKVNRFWPNDNIQTRKHVFVPVDACNVRGTRIENQVDLLNSGLDGLGVSNGTTEQAPHSQNDATVESPISLSLVNSPTDDPEYRHDSWMQLPSFITPTEVLRVPRRKLGYFSRTRRKSNVALIEQALTQTPRTSFDLLRHPPTHAATMSLNSSPVRRSANPKVSQQIARSRSASTSQQAFAEVLQGPGGVGSLRGLRTEASRPGPADDPLNRKFAQYLPDLAPPKDMPMASLLGSRLTPRASTDSLRSSRSNTSSSGIANVGGALEGWVRNFASSGANKKDRSATVTKMGDLIELETNSSSAKNFDVSWDMSGRSQNRDGDGLGEVERDDDRTPTPTTQNFPSTQFDSTTRSEQDRTPKALQSEFTPTPTEQELLDERFPIRGRVRTAYKHGK